MKSTLDNSSWHFRRLSGHPHDTLVAGPDILQSSMIQTSRNLRTLLLDSHQDIAGLVIEPLLRRVIPNLLDGLSDDLLVIDLGFRCDLPKHLIPSV